VIEFRHAIRDALAEELERDEDVVFFGEDVAAAGGVFAVTPGLLERFGPDRVFDTPFSELALAGALGSPRLFGTSDFKRANDPFAVPSLFSPETRLDPTFPIPAAPFVKTSLT